MKIRQYILDNYELEEIKSITEHGCISGAASTLIYYNETTEFYNIHHDEIWDILTEQMDGQGYSNIFEFLATHNPKYINSIGTDSTFKNYLVWFAIEEISSQIINENEE